MSISRRRFCTSVLASAPLMSRRSAAGVNAPAALDAAATGSHVGTLYPFIQGQADASRFELSFLQPEFKDLRSWQPAARARIFEHLFYAPPAVDPQPEVMRRTDKGDYFEEYLTFRTTPDLRVPAFVLVPKRAERPAPGVVVLHSHDGVYLWGKEKVVATDHEHPYLKTLKARTYGGTSIATELVRRGYVVAVIDMFYWGERRMILDGDPPAYRERPPSITEQEVNAFNQRSSRDESLLARTLLAAGITWPGVILWDDIRTLDYLASRPEVDSKRLACVGLSVGGYRSFLLAALDERIKAAVDVGWMTSFGSQIKQHVVHTVGLSFHIAGLYRYMDLPDFSALIAPRALLVINGSRDQLFAPDGVKRAFDKIARCYAKAGVPERQRCSLYDAPHQFNGEMQAEAWQWLARWV